MLKMDFAEPKKVFEDVECWDDDGDFQGLDGLNFRTCSTTASSFTADGSAHPSGHRDSTSSRLSARSDSIAGCDEDWQVLLSDGEEGAKQSAIASAQSAGIPLPSNVPTSALLGGTIKRLGARKLKKTAFGDDWSEDLELPSTGEELQLKLKANASRDFPDTLRQISDGFPESPFKSPLKRSPRKEHVSFSPPKFEMDVANDDEIDFNATIRPKHRDPEPIESSASPSKSHFSPLDRWADTEDGDDGLGEIPMIAIAKTRSPRKVSAGHFNAFSPKKATRPKESEDLLDGIELPEGDQPLRLSNRKEQPRTPGQIDDIDIEWAEGSLGTRFGGTRRDGRSNRSSTVSAFSPSMSSCLTAESEDEGMEGLVLPEGPLRFDELLKKRQQVQEKTFDGHRQENQPPRPSQQTPVAVEQAPKSRKRLSTGKEDFFSGLEIGDGEVFDSKKLTLNRNIKVKTIRPDSPARRSAVNITFTNKAQGSTATRIPRPPSHERPYSAYSALEPVFEGGGAVVKYRRSQSRAGAHSAQSSLSSIPLPSIQQSNVAPSTPNRRGYTSKSSTDVSRLEPTTTSAQLLKAQRSMPAVRSPKRNFSTSFQRPSSRGDAASRAGFSRPKTPVDKIGLDSYTRQPPVPFLPAGSSASSSQHRNVKSTRVLRRTEGSNENFSFRSNSRLSDSHRPETPKRGRAPEALAKEAVTKRKITRPARRRNYGDGTELEIFDDLPTSAVQESKFVKQPIGRGAPRTLRNKPAQSQLSSAKSEASRTATPPSLSSSLSPPSRSFTPHFARDTNASRTAREQRIASLSVSLKREYQPLAAVAISSNTKTQSSTREMPVPTTPHIRRKKARVAGATHSPKPQLIKPMGNGVQESKTIKGMRYNPTTYRWEGNDAALSVFNHTTSSPGPRLGSPPHLRSPKAAPALITNPGGSALTGVQVVGGMVFDPQRMCWLKMAPVPHQHRHSKNSKGLANQPFVDEDEEDVFAGLSDLSDGPVSRRRAHGRPPKSLTSNSPIRPSTKDTNETFTGEQSNGDSSASDSMLDNDWLVGEEFDVGPAFVHRQRAEEERWKRKVGRWVRDRRPDDDEEARWAIRDLLIDLTARAAAAAASQ